jgi:hypothetical protein
MYRSRTVELMLRDFARERQVWAAERRDLNDRLAALAGRPWTLPPVEFSGPAAPDPYADYIVPEAVALDEE